MVTSRRKFIKRSSLSLLAAGMATTLPSISIIGSAGIQAKKSPFKISLAQWSLRDHFWKKPIKAIAFPIFTDDNFGIKGLE